MVSPTPAISVSSTMSSIQAGTGVAGKTDLQSQRAAPVADFSQGSTQTTSRAADRPLPSARSEESTDAPRQAERSTRSEADSEQQVQQVLRQLKSRDVEVRAHEMAHLGAAGGYATSGANYVYQVGPDGKRYAIGGEVGIDTSPVPGDPQATLQKAMVVQRAALAPAEPSSQDLKVARAAMQMASQARVELSQQTDDGSPDETGAASDSEQNKAQSATDTSQSDGPARIDESASENQSYGGLLQRSEFNMRLALQASA